MATVLVADDNTTDRQLLTTLLRYSGHQSLEARDGLEALEIAKRERPHLIITDVLMPGMDGFDFVRALRTQPELGTTAVIFYTALYYEQSARALAAACGVTHLLTKPTDPAALLAAIADALDSPVPAPPAPAQDVEHQHIQLLNDKLAQSVRTLEATNTRLAVLSEIGRYLGSESDPQALVEKFCGAARDLLACECAVVGIVGEDGDTLRQHVVRLGGDRAGRVQATPDDWRQVGSWLMGQNGVVRLNGDDLRRERPGLLPALGATGALIGTWIATQSRVYGWACFLDKLGAQSFGTDDEMLVSSAAGQLAVAYENAQRYALVRRYALELEARVAEVQAQRSELETLLDSMAEGVLAVDTELRITRANAFAARVLAAEPSALVGRALGEVMRLTREPGAPPGDLISAIRAALGRGELLRIDDLWLDLPLNGRLAVSVTVASDRARHGGVVVFQDVSQQRELDEARDSFVSLVSHELRTPIHHIKGFASTLLQPDVEWPEEMRQDFVQTIEREADRLSRLVESLLEMARLESGRFPPHPEPVAVEAVVAASLRQAAPLTASHRVAVELNGAGLVWADASQLERVLVNLLENAAKYSPVGTRIEVRAHRRGGEVLVEVADQGMGIPPAERARVFDKFIRLEGAQQQAPGTGLGLAICKAIVEQHGGRIWVEGEVGKGATICFTLPAARGASKTQQ